MFFNFPGKRRLKFLSLGCDKNLVDTEKILAQLKCQGYEIVSHLPAEIMLINTCAFIEPAKQESIEEILLAVELKKEGKIKKLVVVGCMVELYKEELEKEIPEVDLWIKYSEIEQVSRILLEESPQKPLDFAEPRVITTPSHISYLKIAEGCDRGCSFCVIPRIRGRFYSLREDELLKEAKFLEEKGVKELNLVAQDLSDYGKDTGSSLLRLLERLLKETQIPWLRLFYLNPEGINSDLIELVGKEERICSYFDLPFQHISEKILSQMRRAIREKELKRIIELIREQIPQAVIRGTALVGFPGETKRDFEELIKFVEWAEFDWLGVFAFSPEPFAPASKLSHQIPEQIALQRKEELELFWQGLAEEKNQAKVGKVYSVLVDNPDDLGYDFQGRSFEQGYEVDGVIHLRGNFSPGKFYQIQITEELGLDLVGEKAQGGEK